MTTTVTIPRSEIDADVAFRNLLGELPRTIGWVDARLRESETRGRAGELLRLMAALRSAAGRGDVTWSMRHIADVEPDLTVDERQREDGAIWEITVWSPGGVWSPRPYLITGRVRLVEDAWGVPMPHADGPGHAWVGGTTGPEESLFHGWSVANLLVDLWRTAGAARILTQGLHKGAWADEAQVPTWEAVSAGWRDAHARQSDQRVREDIQRRAHQIAVEGLAQEHRSGGTALPLPHDPDAASRVAGLIDAALRRAGVGQCSVDRPGILQVTGAGPVTVYLTVTDVARILEEARAQASVAAPDPLAEWERELLEGGVQD
jgi:hypothetical protein